MYYNARYYDPHIGQFISPDTIVPDPSNVSDYNRYMYVRGNPINANDPSGHQTETTILQLINLFITTLGAAEELGFTATGASIYAGGNGSAGAFLHGEGASEIQGTINWHSDQVSLLQTNSAGLKGGHMIDNSAGGHLGLTLHFNASDVRSLQGASVYLSGSTEAELFWEGGITGTYSRSADYKDWNRNGQFDMNSESFSALTPTDQGLDPVFKTAVHSLSLDMTMGYDITPNLIEWGIAGGGQDTNEVFTIENAFAPLRWAVNQMNQMFD